MTIQRPDQEEDYQQSEIGLIPRDWKVVKLKDIAEKLKAGGTPLKAIKEYWNGDIPFVKIEDITSAQKYLTETISTISEKGLNNSSAWIVPPYSILLSMYASIGEVGINKIALATNQAILAIIPKKENDVEYLYYCLRYHAKRLYSLIVQTTQKNVNKGITENLLIPLPRPQEQKKIAFVLSQIQKAIEQQDKIIQATNNLKKSLMQKLFTKGIGHTEFKDSEVGEMPKNWQTVKFHSIMSEKTLNGIYKNKEHYGKGYKIVRMTEFFKRDILEIDEMKRINLSKEELLRYSLREGDLLFARRSLKVEGSGKCVLVPSINEPVVFESSIIRVRLDRKRALPNFYMCYLNSGTGRKLITRIIRTLAVSGVTSGDVRELVVPLPTFTEQEEIADSLNSINRKIDVGLRRKTLLQQLFKTMLHKLMTGEIRVKGLDLGVLDVN